MTRLKSRQRALRRPTDDAEEGSVLLLTLGYVLLAFAVIAICACATDLYLAQKRLDALADSAALAGSDGYSLVALDDGVNAELTDAGVREQAEAIVEALPGDAVLVDAHTPDGTSSSVTVSAVWHPPLFSPFVPDGVMLESTGTSRTALQ